ncbi:MAG: nitroreductase family protein [Moorella sp. (in: firmicutes)]
MDVWEAITKRRSIRAFKAQEVTDALLLKLVEAGRWAPSGSNIQPLHFVLIRAPGQIKKIQAFAPGMSGGPPAVIAICADLALAERRGGKLGREVMCLMDAAMAAQNIALAAVEMELGTCVIRSFNPQAVQSILKLPQEIVPQLLVTVGYPTKIPTAPKRKDLEKITSWEEYLKAGD